MKVKGSEIWALPRLQGRWLTAYAVVWSLVLAVAIGATSVGAWREMTSAPVWNPYGFYIFNQPDAAVATTVFGEEAKASGLKGGDRILAIDGVSVASLGRGEIAFERAMRRPEGGVVDLTVATGAQPARHVRLPRRQANIEITERQQGMTTETRNLLQIAFGLIGAGGLTAAAVLLFRRRRDPVAALLSISLLLFVATGQALGALFWSAFGLHLQHGLIGGVTIFLLWFGVFVFPAGRVERPWMWGLVAGAALLSALSGLWNVPFLRDGGGLLVLLPICLAAVALRYRATRPGPERQQIRRAFLGFAAGAAALLANAAMTIWLRPVAMETSMASWEQALELAFTALAALLIAGGLLVSLLRYRLYDADAAISRSVAYGALTLALVAVFAGGEKVIESIGQAYLGGSLGMMAGGLAAVLAAVLVAPMHHRVSRWAEGRFQSHLVRLRDSLPRLVGDLRETAAPRRIAEAVLEEVTAGVRAARAALVLDGSLESVGGLEPETVERWLAAWTPDTAPHRDLLLDKDDAVFPVRLPLSAEGEPPAGWLLLGPRPDGSLYGRDEREALAAIAGPVARALAIARTREAAALAQERRLASLEGAVEALTALLRQRPA